MHQMSHCIFDWCRLLFLFSSPHPPGGEAGVRIFCVPTSRVGSSGCFHAQQVLPFAFGSGASRSRSRFQGGAERLADCRKKDVSLYFLSHRALNSK